MILPLNMMLAIYGLVAFAVLLLTLFSKSHRTMNILSIVLPASYVALTLFTLTYAALPAYSLGGSYFLMDHLRSTKSSFRRSLSARCPVFKRVHRGLNRNP